MLAPVLLMSTGMALVPLVQRVRAWLKARSAGDGDKTGKDSEGGSLFSFFGKLRDRGKGGGGGGRGTAAQGKSAAASAKGGMKRPPGAGAASHERAGSMPRSGKMSSNKKNRARKADKRVETEARRQQEAEDAAKLAAKGGGGKGGHGAQKGNNVPKDDDIVGGEAGKTFTTSSHVKVPTWYAKVREERGTD